MCWFLDIPSIPIALKSRYFSNGLFALIFAFYYSLFLDELDVTTYRVLETWQTDSPEETFFKKLSQPFLAHLLNSDGGYETWYDKLIDQSIVTEDGKFFELNVQIFIFHKNSGTLLHSFPSKYDDTRRPLFLAADESEDPNIRNLLLITNLTTFFNIFGIFCFFCEKAFKGKGTQHKCSKITTCFSCKRPFLRPSTCVNIFTKNLYCPSSMSASVAQKCSKCNIRFFSPQCEGHHNKKVCRFGWFCENCETYTFCSKSFPNVASIKKNHKCGSKTCYFCGFEKKCFHQCDLQLPQHQSFLTKVGFIDIQTTGNTKISCKSCFDNDMQCSFCKDNTMVLTNICTIMYENTSREKFDKAMFFSYKEAESIQNSWSFKYLPDSCIDLPYAKPTFFNKCPKNRLDPKIFHKAKASPMEQMFFHLFTNKLFNITFISHDDENGRVLEEVCKALVENGIIPHVVGHSSLWLVELSEVGLRFISSLNYFSGSILSFCKRFNYPPYFFPKRWNKKSFFSYCGISPSLDDFFSVDDSEDVIEKKKKIISDKKSKQMWNFQDELKTFSLFRLKIMAITNLSFLKEAFECQQLLFSQLSPNKKTFLMPFNPPFFTRASYAFQLMLYFVPPNLLKTNRPPIRMTSSKQELEFCAFLKWKYPNLTFVDAWSPYGQMSFKESFPDSVCIETKTAFYFNGCLIHGHPISECKFKRKHTNGKNYFKVDFLTAFNNHNRKLALLQQNHPDKIVRTETVWECLWQYRKKNEEELKNFMKIYFEPPLQRLDASHAVRGGLNELYGFSWEKAEKETFHYDDINSSYPYEAAGFLPVGEYEVREDLNLDRWQKIKIKIFYAFLSCR